MATVEIWIQLENHPWDVCPQNKDRMTGQNLKDREGKDPVQNVTLTSPGSGKTRKMTMYKPLSDQDDVIDALILRRYLPPITIIKKGGKGRAAWAVPDDRKVNPWDLNEPDPTDKGTMGTIPGPVIECNVGDKVIVHFRNRDKRTHSVTETVTKTVHTTCIEKHWEYDPKEKPVHKPVLVEEEVPCDKTVTETHTFEEDLPVEMRTHSLHPHGFAFLAAHDGAYPLSPPDESQPVGSEQPLWDLLNVKKFKKGDRVPPLGTFDYTWIAGAPSEDDPETIEPWPTTAGVWLYHDHSICDMDNVNLGAIGIIVIHNPDDENQEVDIRKPTAPTELDPNFLPSGSATGPVTFVKKDDKFYFPPPSKALYLQLFHTLTGLGTMGGMLINGRQYLGSTPTLIAGPETLMRFGVIGMGNDFHTFHIHGHRWIVPGPNGIALPDPENNPESFQNSPQIRAVSQFEDTRIFGPANSFVFTIQEGEFFGARDDDPTGEFHMHCHVLQHMDMGMMGSLLILPEDGGKASNLPEGVPCLSDMGGDMPATDGVVEVSIVDNRFDPPNVTVKKGQKVRWTNNGADMAHTAPSNNHPGANFTNCSPAATEDFHSGLLAHGAHFEHTFNTVATHGYHCDVHGCGMSGTVKVT
jgi:plastocyanin/FtsP/CotA-like multicopper oxidase with cupredoxin domain